MKIVVLTSDSAADRAVELTGVEIETQHANNHKSVLCRPGNLKNNVIKTSNNDDLRFWWQYFSIHPLRNSCFQVISRPQRHLPGIARSSEVILVILFIFL